ncbi:MAG: M48 family peptidase [Acidobacteria bacterium]|nr:MAG: M48 family peptidase [Acidobacteriota bacterium]
MQLRLPLLPPPGPTRGDPAREVIVAGRRTVTVTFVRHPRARNYLLRVEPDGGVRATIPRGGSRAQAVRFVREKLDWIQRERYRAAVQQAAGGWVREDQVLLDGREWPVTRPDASDGPDVVRFADHEVRVGALAAGSSAIVRAVETYLRRVAASTLPRRLLDLAAPLGFLVTGVTVRDQRSRWGSCSPSGRISLNWRLIQVPPSVRDYVLLHELAHLHHPDHSRRYWKELERICPWHREARAWLRASARPAFRPPPSG